MIQDMSFFRFLNQNALNFLSVQIIMTIDDFILIVAEMLMSNIVVVYLCNCHESVQMD